MFRIYDVSKIYLNGFQALKGVSFETPQTGLLTITGDSGSGKSTLLNLLSGLDSFDGKISCDGYNINTKNADKYRKKYVSNVFQDFKLLEGMTVEDNIALGAESVGKRCTHADVVKLLADVGLSEDNYKKHITELSGGERQRISIARALAKDTPIILADEPTGNLDKRNSRKIFELLKIISTKKLVMIVTHNDVLSKEFADSNIHLDNGEIVGRECMVQKLDSNNALDTSLKSNENRNKSMQEIPKVKEKLSIKTMSKLNYMTAKSKMLTIIFAVLSAFMMFATFCTASLLDINALSVTRKTLADIDCKITNIEKFGATFAETDFGEQVYYSFNSNVKFDCDFDSHEDNDIIIYDAGFAVGMNNIVECNDVVDVGLEIICGRNVLEYDEIVISEYHAVNILRTGNMSGHIINSYEDLIGLEIDGMNIVGISSSDMDKYIGEYADVTYGDMHELSDENIEEIRDIRLAYAYSVDCNVAFVKEGYSDDTRNNYGSLNSLTHQLSLAYDVRGYSSSDLTKAVYDKDMMQNVEVKYVDLSHTQLLEGQILMSTQAQMLMELEGVLDNNVLKASICDKDGNASRVEYDVIGYYASDCSDVLMNEDSYAAFFNDSNAIFNSIYFDGSEVNLDKLYNSFNSEFDGTEYENNRIELKTVASHNLHDITDNFTDFYVITLIINIVFALMTALFFILNIYSFIKSKKRDIVVLRMIGISKKSVVLPIAFFFGVLFLIELIFALGLYFGALAVFNSIFQTAYIVFFKLLYFNAMVVPILITLLLGAVIGMIVFYVNKQYTNNALDKYNE